MIKKFLRTGVFLLFFALMIIGSSQEISMRLPDDRQIDWSVAGVWAGEVKGIPDYPVGVTCASPKYKVYPNQATDSRAGIQSAIDACPAGRAVFLPAGTYMVGGTIRLKSRVSLRGAGAGITTIASSASPSVQIGTSTLYKASRYNVRGGIAKGATKLVLAAAPPATCKVGGLILIDELADYDLMWHRSGLNSRVHSSLARITAVSGHTISFSPPNVYEFTEGLMPQARFETNVNVVSLSGIESLTISGSMDLGLQFFGSDRCWAKNIEVTGFSGSRAMIRVTRALQTEIRGSYIHDCANFPNQADGYGIYCYYESCFSLIEDNIFDKTAAAIIGAGTSGNVYSYNYVNRVRRAGIQAVLYGINSNHGPHGLMSLSEGNILPQWENDGYHGSTSHQTLFRNSLHGKGSDNLTRTRWIVNLARASYYHNCIGNILGDPSWEPDAYELTGQRDSAYSGIYKLEYPNSGNTRYTTSIVWDHWTKSWPDPDVAGTLIRHANFDYHTKSVVWDDSYGRELPASLYLESKPSWFGSLDWPAIGPDVAGYSKNIPAKLRWDRYVQSGLLSDLFSR